MNYAQLPSTETRTETSQTPTVQVSPSTETLPDGGWLGGGDECSATPPTADDLHALDIAVEKLEAVFDFAAETLEDSLGDIAEAALSEVRASPAAWFGSLAGDRCRAMLTAAIAAGAAPVVATLASAGVGAAVDNAVSTFLGELEGQVVDGATIRAFFHRYTLGWRLGFRTTAGALAGHGAEQVREATAGLEHLCGPGQSDTIEALKGSMLPPFLDLAARSARPDDHGTVSSRYALTAVVTSLGDGSAALGEVWLPTDISSGDATALRGTPGALERSAVRVVSADRAWSASATSSGIEVAEVDPTAAHELQRIAEPDEERLADLRLRADQGDTDAAATLDELERTAVVLMWSDVILQTNGLSLDELGVPVHGADR